MILSKLKSILGISRLRGRRGAVAILFVFAIGMAANTIATKFFSDTQIQYAAVKVSSDGFRARQLALAGFQSGLAALRAAPEEQLYTSGIALKPPDISVSSDCKPGCFISYRIMPEDGKLNLNNLVHSFDDKPNEQYRAIFKRFWGHFNIPVDNVDSLIDWIDEDDAVTGVGAENSYYASLKPMRKCKNYRMFSMAEVSLVKGFTTDMVFGSRAPENWEKNQKGLSFQTEDEKNLITMDDWIPSNNLTAYVPYGDKLEDKININAARYHTLMSLSESMTREAVLALFKYRRQKNGYIKELGEIRNLPEFQRKTPQDLTLFDELAGNAGKLAGIIKTEGEIYRIVGIGTVTSAPPGSDNSKGSVVRRVNALYDKNNNKVIYYSED
ncbi:MAG: general secretion pathway protein GspK [Leptospirales bacterium]|nr:general secretion pathway protein GspK [Leptospirales bacterium]